MRVALVHEFLTQLGGAERVLQSFHELFPKAPVFTLVYDKQRTKGVFESWDLRTSFLQKLPGMPKSYKWYLSLMPRAMENFDFRDFDLILSDSSAFAKGIKIKKETVHICYCHTPTRYLWEEMDDYVRNISYPGWVKVAVRPFLWFLRSWDYKAAQRPDFFIANSRTVQSRIKKYYDRDSNVIYPPVDTEFFNPVSRKQNYYFTASRLEPYKKIDLVIKAFNELSLPLRVAGTGSIEGALKGLAKNNIEFLGRVTDEELRELYSASLGFILPALEDAGIMVLEAMACGTPAIGFASGGTAEYIQNRKNGLLFSGQTVANIVSTIATFKTINFDSGVLRQYASQFGKQIFKKKIMNFINAHRD